MALCKGRKRRYRIRISANPIFSGLSKRSYSIRIWLDCWKSFTLFFSCSLHHLWKAFNKDHFGKIRSPFPAQTFELAAFRHLVEFVNSRGEQWNQGTLWPERTRFAFD